MHLSRENETKIVKITHSGIVTYMYLVRLGQFLQKERIQYNQRGKSFTFCIHTYLSAALDFIRRKKILTIYIYNPIHYFLFSHAFTQFEFLTIGMFKVKYCLCFILRSPYVKIGSKKINILQKLFVTQIWLTFH